MELLLPYQLIQVHQVTPLSNPDAADTSTAILQCSDYNLIGSYDPINRAPDGLSLPSANDNVLSGDESHSICSYANGDIANNIISNKKMKILYTNLHTND